MKYSQLILVLVIISISVLFVQKLEPKKRVLIPEHTISSEIIDINYKLYISFPKEIRTKMQLNTQCYLY